MIILILLLFLPFMVFGQEESTGTVSSIIPPTTYQVLLDGFNDIGNKEDIILEIEKELAKNPDSITGQLLLNYKIYLEIDMKHEKQGRNYFGYINYPVYKKGE